MKRKYMGFLACCLLCWACSVDPLDELDGNEKNETGNNTGGETGGSGNVDASGNLLDLKTLRNVCRPMRTKMNMKIS